MRKNVTTNTHSQTPHITINLTRSNITPDNWGFLRQWANNLGVSLEELLRRILIGAVIGQLYAERIPKI